MSLINSYVKRRGRGKNLRASSKRLQLERPVVRIAIEPSSKPSIRYAYKESLRGGCNDKHSPILPQGLILLLFFFFLQSYYKLVVTQGGERLREQGLIHNWDQS